LSACILVVDDEPVVEFCFARNSGASCAPTVRHAISATDVARRSKFT
jgi:hypothetical protein